MTVLLICIALFSGSPVFEFASTYSHDFNLIFLFDKTYQLKKELLVEKKSNAIRYMYRHKYTVWACTEDHIIRINLKSYEIIGKVDGAKINSIVYVNQNDLWGGSSDSTIRIWDAESGQVKKVIQAHDGNILVLFSYGGLVWSGGGDKTIRIWNALLHTWKRYLCSSCLNQALAASRRCLRLARYQLPPNGFPRRGSASKAGASKPSTEPQRLPYRYAVATILERTPIIMPEPTPEERAFLKFQLLMANAQARELSPEVMQRLFGESGDAIPDKHPFLNSKVFELDDSEYVPAPRETEADRTNDRRSLRRKLDQWLFLIVQRKLGPTGRSLWQFPQRFIEEERLMQSSNDPMPLRAGTDAAAASAEALGTSGGAETRCSKTFFFRGEAEKALQSLIETGGTDDDDENDFEAHFIGNAPCAHLKHVYSPALQEAQGISGIKIFFYRAQLISGCITGVRAPAAVDYAWVTAEELPEYLPPDYYRSVAPVVW